MSQAPDRSGERSRRRRPSAGAVDRALELFDLTARDERYRGHRCREILPAREEFVCLFFGAPTEPASVEDLRR